MGHTAIITDAEMIYEKQEVHSNQFRFTCVKYSR